MSASVQHSSFFFVMFFFPVWNIRAVWILCLTFVLQKKSLQVTYGTLTKFPQSFKAHWWLWVIIYFICSWAQECVTFSDFPGICLSQNLRGEYKKTSINFLLCPLQTLMFACVMCLFFTGNTWKEDNEFSDDRRRKYTYFSPCENGTLERERFW